MRRSIFGYLEDEPSRRGLRLGQDSAKHEAWSEAILPADAAAATPESDTNRRPLLVFAALATALMVILGLRLFALQVLSGNQNLALADGNRIRERVARAPRGLIYDRNGVVLAQNQASYDVTVTPQLLPRTAIGRQQEYERLAGLVGRPAAEVAKSAEADCKPPATDCFDSPVAKLVIAGLPRETALLVDAAATDLPGFVLDVNPVRQYPAGNALSIILGYTGRVNAEEAAADSTYGSTDLIGKLGLEKEYESLLRGTNGGDQTEVDATGRPVKVLAERPPVPGHNLVLSVDSALQTKLSEAIAKQITAAGATRGAGVALNPKTGEVLASVSLPSFDNNLFAKGISAADYQRLANDLGQPLFDKATGGTYPSGSIIKPLVASAALQEHTITPQTSMTDVGYIDVPNENDPAAPAQRFRSYEAGGLGLVDLFGAIAKSSNVYFYSVGGGFGNIKGLGITRLAKYFNLFGLGDKTGIDLPSEARGRVPTPEWKQKALGEAWFKGDTFNTSVGQGNLLVSPLQMAVATAAVANGGNLIKPHFLKAVQDANGKVIKTVSPEIVRQGFIDPANLQVVRQAMRDVVAAPYGTACCRIEQEVPVQVAAKTGTAENGSAKNPHAWFEAFAPYNDPQIVVVVLVERAGEGAMYAAPAVRETLSWYFTQGAGAKH